MEDLVTAPTPLDKRWLTEAVRLREEHAGPLEDQEANRHARQRGGDLSARIEARALFLAERDGMASALRHWKQGARLALLALLLMAVLSGAAWPSPPSATGCDRSTCSGPWAACSD